MTEKEPQRKGKESAQGSPRKRQPQSWDTESSFDEVVSLEELIRRSPFKEASSKDGGSYTAAARIPLWLERKITYLLEVKGTPYQLKGDVVRDAIYLGLRILGMRYRSDPTWAVDAKLAQVTDQVYALSRIRNQVESFARPVVDLWENGDEEQARHGIEDFVAAAVELEDPWMREKTLQFLKSNKSLQPVIESCSEEVKRAVYPQRK